MALVPFPGPQSGAIQLPSDDDDESPGGKMSFLEHLDELRKRIVHSAIAIAICVLAGFYWITQIVNFILAPTRKALPAGRIFAALISAPFFKRTNSTSLGLKSSANPEFLIVKIIERIPPGTTLSGNWVLTKEKR